MSLPYIQMLWKWFKRCISQPTI